MHANVRFVAVAQSFVAYAVWRQISTTNTLFYILTDNPKLRERARDFLGSSISFLGDDAGKTVHLEDARSVADAMRTFVEWFLFRYVNDAVILMFSNFGYTAVAPSNTIPVCVSNNQELVLNADSGLESLDAQCVRRLKSHVKFCPNYGN